MAIFPSIDSDERSTFQSNILSCPSKEQWISFQLVDENGNGAPYAGLCYKLMDSTLVQYVGVLDSKGSAKIHDCYKGPAILHFDSLHSALEQPYRHLADRYFYPLPITELQVRAEKTHFFHKDGFRTEHNPANKNDGNFIQVEVRDLVKNGAHLPPVVDRHYPPKKALLDAVAQLSPGQDASDLYGVGLMPNRHTVLEVRPLRAFRPLLSTANEFSALNLYQLSIMAGLSYSDFGQKPPVRPTHTVEFKFNPSVGNFFGDALANFRQSWRVEKDQSSVTRYYPLYEEVPYSKRFEILPFDPTLYESNLPEKEEEQEHPANLHFFTDHDEYLLSGKSTQAYITHHDEIILIGIRGTLEKSDWWRDADAEQVPFEEGTGHVHHGFYDAYKALKNFIKKYLSQFYTGQKIIISGHSLGGAIALILAEALRNDKEQQYDILLYTYGAPRAGDAAFVEAARPLVHHRMVNNDDVVPSVPAPWMNARRTIWLPGLASLFVINPVMAILIFVGGLVRVGGKPYEHHGTLHHFMPVRFGAEEKSSILWNPGCASIEEAACTRALAKDGDLPWRGGLIQQFMSFGDHSLAGSYIPFSWATLRRWQQTEKDSQTVVTNREYRLVSEALQTMRKQVLNKSREAADTKGYANNEPDYIQTVNDYSGEYGKLGTALQRLKTQNDRYLTLNDVYGTAAQSDQLQPTLDRWMAQRENQVQVQIAMIPQLTGYDLEVASAGKPYFLDLDSIV
ncbi:lipase family protein [Pseudomonas lundensis]|uniref:lipase family protein n=1 Tax=Pseudomonas lundensis TaxID=86185 RepID=UPI00089DC2E7|nr:lipase family protein [Pseudomonas lundensis]